MRSLVRFILLLLVAAFPGQAANAIPPVQLWNFDSEPPGTLPRDLTIGTLLDGRPAGEWRLFRTARAKSPPQVLGQVMGKGDDLAYKVVLLTGTTALDVDAQVSLLLLEGKKDVGGGLIWRATDDRNYYVARANALEQTIDVIRVTEGVAQLLRSYKQPVGTQQWHTLRVLHRGCRLEVFFARTRIGSLCDQALPAGRIGLWTKADAVTYFDDLQLQRLK
jgi:hypothetical protein